MRFCQPRSENKRRVSGLRVGKPEDLVHYDLNVATRKTLRLKVFCNNDDSHYWLSD